LKRREGREIPYFERWRLLLKKTMREKRTKKKTVRFKKKNEKKKNPKNTERIE
jgi:hypothetical protein